MHRSQRDNDVSQPARQVNAGASRPSARRLASGGWGRLRAPQVDPLEVYGLPSKGETRLNDVKTQESYYRKIVDRYMRFCANAGTGHALDAAFRAMHVSGPSRWSSTSTPEAPPPPPPPTTAGPRPVPERRPGQATVGEAATSRAERTRSSTSQTSLSSSASQTLHEDDSRSTTRVPTPPTPASLSDTQRGELGLILSAMRKLREALTATKRADLFAQRAYLFILRSTILMRQWEAYVPCLLHLIHRLHPVTPLGQSEFGEVVGWLVLDMAIRQGRLREARELLHRHARSTADPSSSSSSHHAAPPYGPAGGPSSLVHRTLTALVRDDWLTWRDLKRRVDGYGRALMDFGEDGFRLQVLKVVGRAYMRIDLASLEAWTARGWRELKAEGVGWQLLEEEDAPPVEGAVEGAAAPTTTTVLIRTAKTRGA